MIAATFDIAKLVGNNMTPDQRRMLDQFNALDEQTRRDMLRAADTRAREYLERMRLRAVMGGIN